MVSRLVVVCVLLFAHKISALDICAFKTGDANFAILRRGVYALIVDCGAANPADFELGDARDKVIEVLKGVKAIKIFVTHDHRDHQNLIRVLFEKATYRPTVSNVIPQIMISSYKQQQGAIGLLGIGVQCVYTKNSEANRSVVLGFLNGSLDTDVEVLPFLSGVDPGLEAHDHNVLLKVSFGTRSVLFTGDASGHLLTRLLATQSMQLQAFLSNVTVTFLPHHGSNKNSEQMYFFYTRSPVNYSMCSGYNF
jgi:beta-lactamase superfamily II metal-dependent hydrolase